MIADISCQLLRLRSVSQSAASQLQKKSFQVGFQSSNGPDGDGIIGQSLQEGGHFGMQS